MVSILAILVRRGRAPPGRSRASLDEYRKRIVTVYKGIEIDCLPWHAVKAVDDVLEQFIASRDVDPISLLVYARLAHRTGIELLDEHAFSGKLGCLIGSFQIVTEKVSDGFTRLGPALWIAGYPFLELAFVFHFACSPPVYQVYDLVYTSGAALYRGLGFSAAWLLGVAGLFSILA
jgi:hypothetical protein